MATEKAQSVLEEIKSTEQTYLAGLKHLLSNKEKMLAAYNKSKPSQLEGKISQVELKLFFDAIQDLINDSERLLAQINNSTKNYESITKIIESSAKHFSDAAIFYHLILQKKLPENVAASFKGESKNKSALTTFGYHAIMPAQRVPRYEMLFKELQKRQAEDIEKKRIQTTINAAINVAKQVSFTDEQLVSVQNHVSLVQEAEQVKKYKKDSVESIISQEIYQQLVKQEKDNSGAKLNKQEAILKTYIKESDRYDITITRAISPKDQLKAEQLKRDFTNQYIKFIEKTDPKNADSLRKEIQKIVQNKSHPPIVFHHDKTKVSSSQRPDEARTPSSSPPPPKEKRKL
ncbi:RhoGEF domain-containing protein [Candidatus Berkiella aquae]|uniref:RhoGEF domain protein n=1 Tax=Candidatus Berkiella aquae TaxID=295108 RepID=A0A0Q9YY01_9GAMM|nr:RhoGEF domain-containing protein [Candidatus Berkiella aquae]MCS5711993.1 hypothetical protein [Candidatus Berkiella aquae]